jgi:ethanolamine ammonia-lyase small subunit
MDDLDAKGDADSPSTLDQIRAQTPARILTGRVGGSYTTRTWLELRADHAAARDAVRDDIDLEADFGRAFVERWRLFDVSTRATGKDEYLLRPDLGRSLSGPARDEVARECPSGVDLQVVLGDGLSARAVVAQTPALLPRLVELATAAGWRLGRPFLVRRCRVGVLNDVGDLLDPAVVVLLIGERPGLATAESLSAYLAYRPRGGHDDSRRNLISNIHGRGVPCDQAAQRIVHLDARMMELAISGVDVKETWTPSLAADAGRARSLPEAP